MKTSVNSWESIIEGMEAIKADLDFIGSKDGLFKTHDSGIN